MRELVQLLQDTQRSGLSSEEGHEYEEIRVRVRMWPKKLEQGP